MYKRSGTKIAKAKGSHVIFISPGGGCCNVIVYAAGGK